jgi:hypothetical protein
METSYLNSKWKNHFKEERMEEKELEQDKKRPDFDEKKNQEMWRKKSQFLRKIMESNFFFIQMEHLILLKNNNNKKPNCTLGFLILKICFVNQQNFITNFK